MRSGARSGPGGSVVGTPRKRRVDMGNQINQAGRALASFPDRIRLLEFLTVFHIGGTERQVVNLTNGLDPEQYELHMGCLGRVGPLLEEVTARGIPVSEYKTKNLYNLGSMTAHVQFVVFRIKPIRQIHDLPLSAADVKHGEKLEKSGAILAARD